MSGHGALSRVADDGTSTVVFRGQFTRVAFGGSDEPVQITISKTGNDDTALIPSAYEMVVPNAFGVFLEVMHNITAASQLPYADPINFPDAALRDVGAVYPLVFGGPGDASNPGSPGLIVDQPGGNYQIMIAGHRVTPQNFQWWWPQAVPAVNGTGTNALRNASFTASDITHLSDARGRTVATFTIDPAADNVDLDVDRHGGYFIAWTGGDATPGGAGDVIRRIMRQSSVRFDFQRSAAALNRLNGYQLDGYINDQVAPLQWVTKALLPLLPCSLHSGVDGLYIKLWPWLDGGNDVAFALEAGTDFSPGSLVTYTASAAGTVNLQYKWRADTAQYIGTVEASADTSLWGAAGQTLNTRVEKMETRAIWDDGTAHLVVQDRLRYGARPSRIRRYTCDPSKYGIGGTHELRAGMPVSITDAEVSWDGLIAWVDEIERSGDSMAVQIRIREW
tara:strand:+ start:1026 stop:2372 length:1347 start_codon:yes stop_codon:yes gene_type:complete